MGTTILLRVFLMPFHSEKQEPLSEQPLIFKVYCEEHPLYTQVRKANRERAQLTRSQRKEIGLATMLMVVVFVFFVCNGLALVVNVLEKFGFEIIALNRLSNALVTLNFSVNFIIYCIFGEKFKRIFYQVIFAQIFWH